MPLLRQGPGLVRGVARTAVIAGTASAVNGRVARRQQAKFAEQDADVAVQRQAYADAGLRPAGAAARPPRRPGRDYTAELERLAKLRDEGVITAEDFEAKKKQLLGI